jgi:hypothetical protein
MALRNKEQTGDLLRATADVIDKLRGFLEGDFKDAVEELIAQTKVGDPVPENEATRVALQNWVALVASTAVAYQAVTDEVVPALGRFINAPDINNVSSVLDWFQKYLKDESESIEERGITPGSPAGSPSGDGKVLVSNLDLNGEAIDVGHIGTLRLRCVRDATNGATAGAEQFQIDGVPNGRVYPWDEGAPFVGNSYDYVYGSKGVSADISPRQPRAASGGRLLSVSGNRGNLLRAGNFPVGFANQWELVSGAMPAVETADPINGTQSLNAEANFVIQQLIPLRRIANGVRHAVSIKVEPDNGGSGTVTGQLAILVQNRAGTATYLNLEIDLSALTPGEKVLVDPAQFVTPFTAQDLRVQIALTSLGGTATPPKVKFDDVVVTPMVLVDGKLIAIFDGTTLDAGNAVGRWRFGDTITVATTQTGTGIIQKQIMNRIYGRYLRSSDSPTSEWADPSSS